MRTLETVVLGVTLVGTVLSIFAGGRALLDTWGQANRHFPSGTPRAFQAATLRKRMKFGALAALAFAVFVALFLTAARLGRANPDGELLLMIAFACLATGCAFALVAARAGQGVEVLSSSDTVRVRVEAPPAIVTRQLTGFLHAHGYQPAADDPSRFVHAQRKGDQTPAGLASVITVNLAADGDGSAVDLAWWLPLARRVGFLQIPVVMVPEFVTYFARQKAALVATVERAAAHALPYPAMPTGHAIVGPPTDPSPRPVTPPATAGTTPPVPAGPKSGAQASASRSSSPPVQPPSFGLPIITRQFRTSLLIVLSGFVVMAGFFVSAFFQLAFQHGASRAPLVKVGLGIAILWLCIMIANRVDPSHPWHSVASNDD